MKKYLIIDSNLDKVIFTETETEQELISKIVTHMNIDLKEITSFLMEYGIFYYDITNAENV